MYSFKDYLIYLSITWNSTNSKKYILSGCIGLSKRFPILAIVEKIFLNTLIVFDYFSISKLGHGQYSS